MQQLAGTEGHLRSVPFGRINGVGSLGRCWGCPRSRVQYLGSTVDIVRVSLLALQQCDVCDVLHWVGQSQEDLAFLGRFRNHRSRGSYSKIHHHC